MSDTPIVPHSKPPQGWEYPRCHAIHAPHVRVCSCQVPSVTDYTLGYTGAWVWSTYATPAHRKEYKPRNVR